MATEIDNGSMNKRIHVVHNHQNEAMTIAEIFDAEKYPQLTAVTGELSATFLNRYLGAFVQLEIALGNPSSPRHYTSMETVTKDALANAMLKVANKDAIKLFLRLSSQLQMMALAGILKVEIAPTQALHSRFYLLSNPQTQETRVILGSIDLDEPSFDPNYNRFEDVYIFDNDPLYDNLLNHFKLDLRPVLISYFSNHLLTKAQEQLQARKKANPDEEGDSVVILTNEVTDELVETEMTDLIVDDVQHQLDRQQLRADVPLGMRNVTLNRTRDREEAERRIRQHDLVYKLQKQAVSPRAARPKIKQRDQIAKQIHDDLQATVFPQDLAVEKKYTTFLYDRPLERNITRNQTGLYTPNDTGTYPLPFGQLATISQIKRSLKQIEAVMNGYAQFVVDYTPEYGKRFYEAILYAFTAPFLWEIREKASLNPEDGNDIPNFLILGASAGSGKSTLLRVINQLTWGTDKSMIDFGTIYPMDANQRKAKTVQALESYMKQGSTYPVLIDEIEPYFFQQRQYSRRLIVDTMNQLVNSPKPVAPLIGTTNYHTGFTMQRETARRTYYLQLDKVIDNEKKPVAAKYIFEVRQGLDNTLFKDFVVRMANLLEDDGTPWRMFDAKTGQLDFLAMTRRIFREYYKLADMPVPDYFADGLCDDFGENTRSKWAKLYLAKEEDFRFRPEKNSLIFDISKLNNFNGFSADAENEYRNALPVELCVGGINGKTGKFVEIKATAFYKWIGIDDPHTKPTPEPEADKKVVTDEQPKKKKKSFWARLFG
ncbi:ATP-binding protein [Lactobacillus sp. 3B(2020)]|uniref:ATP-binding protein n=1 Tax=Lactobacillus sp. 3B(2020) TaxID=2695882 RepID=UPI0021042CE9|nr:ATP-binding protein [Lactobacillus sp. 3B(2020)]